ncbi:DNA polymerase III subunit delta [Candidatus Termititenax aidoneus]|uniref:DNA polymerase III subunit delta n=1 Tax=Termititenax aidoneus TaxID=2218524 RepID=A0A388TA86_TERA1|nr:DNA polymerase III subunit delta [Candidatus Termititenax aidoneus]
MTETLVSQKRVRGILNGIVNTGRVANAYIFAGPPRSGKTAAAREFFQKLNKTDSARAVDFYELNAGKTVISVEQIRDLQKYVQYGPHVLPYLVVLLQQAEKLSGANGVSGNAFLKLLEEPPDGVVFILETANPDELLPTIRSRCQTIVFDYTPAREEPPELAELIEFTSALKAKNFWQICQCAEELQKTGRETAQNYLLALAQYWRGQMDFRKARFCLKYAKILQKYVNLRLTLEVWLLQMRDL